MCVLLNPPWRVQILTINLDHDTDSLHQRRPCAKKKVSLKSRFTWCPKISISMVVRTGTSTNWIPITPSESYDLVRTYLALISLIVCWRNRVNQTLFSIAPTLSPLLLITKSNNSTTICSRLNPHIVNNSCGLIRSLSTRLISSCGYASLIMER